MVGLSLLSFSAIGSSGLLVGADLGKSARASNHGIILVRPGLRLCQLSLNHFFAFSGLSFLYCAERSSESILYLGFSILQTMPFEMLNLTANLS